MIEITFLLNHINYDVSMKTKKLFLLPALLLAGCSADSQDKLSILVPTGAPSVAFASFLNDSNFKVIDQPNNIVAQMVNENVDIAVLPTNLGVQQIKKGLKYKLASTITFGNLFICSTGLDEDGVMGDDDYIVSFQENAVPDKIFKSVYDVTVDYYQANAQEAAKCLKLKKDMNNGGVAVDYVLMAEPAVSKLESQGADFSIYANLQEVYKAKYDDQQIFQASIFVRDSLTHEQVDPYLGRVKSYVTSLKTNPSLLEKAKELDEQAETTLGIDIAATVTAIKKDNALGIGYEVAYDHKAEIDTFLNIFGMPETNEEIYYK